MSGIQIIFSVKYARWPVTYHNEWCWPYAQGDLFKIPVCPFMPLESEHFYFALLHVTDTFLISIFLTA
jgi:hypothetical protein